MGCRRCVHHLNMEISFGDMIITGNNVHTFSTLGANDVDTDREGSSDVLGVTDHVHHWDASGVKLKS